MSELWEVMKHVVSKNRRQYLCHVQGMTPNGRYGRYYCTTPSDKRRFFPLICRVQRIMLLQAGCGVLERNAKGFGKDGQRKALNSHQTTGQQTNKQPVMESFKRFVD